MSHSEASCSDVETIEEVVVLVFQEHLVDAIPFQFGSLLVLLWQGSYGERHEGTTEVMFWEDDNGVIEFSLQKRSDLRVNKIHESFQLQRFESQQN